MLMFLSKTAWSQQDAGANAILRGGLEKIKQLEQKAADRDLLAIRIMQLEEELSQAYTNAAQGRLPSAGSRMRDMETKVKNYDEMVGIVRKLKKEKEALEQRLEQGIQQVNSGKSDLVSVRDQVGAMSNTVRILQENEKKLRATIDQLLLGNFEYYEVKTGDTLESIAGKPMIYDDASKVEWLRQANAGRLKDLEHLKEGDVLIIPHFRVEGPFSF